MFLETPYSPTVPVEGAASYKLWPVFPHSNGYWEVYERFQGVFFGWGEGLRRGVLRREFSIEEFVVGEGNFHERGAGFFSIFFKEQWKNKYEIFFSTESKEEHYNLKRTEIVTHMHYFRNVQKLNKKTSFFLTESKERD